MESLAAIGLAGNIITFIEFSYKVVSGVNKVLSNASGMTPENERLSVLVDDLNLASKNLVTNLVAQTENEKQLCVLAAKCHELSEEINQILSHLKLEDNHSKWDGLKVKWRSMRKEKDIESIERRLDGYRSQILIRLQIMFGENADRNNQFVNNQLAVLRIEGKSLQNKTASQLDNLHNDISTLVKSLQLQLTQNQDLGSKEKPFIDLGVSLATFQSAMASYSQENKVLKLLAFEYMYSRENDIENAEIGTFAWIIDEEAQKKDNNCLPEEDERNGTDTSYPTSFRFHKQYLAEQQVLRDSTREKFRLWLSSGRHIFHISGKAGSGKSTLMKFLAKSAHVQESLKYWAGVHPLVFVKHFFWNSGEKKQMSLEGLYRSLLFEVCRQMPNLIPRIFPELWRRPSLGIAPIQFDEIKEAFSRLIQEASTSEIHFCFFIDGLDEFEGDEVDHWNFSRDLQSWTSQANNFKLCVSSRPHVTFMKSFSGESNHQISIHELTREDIFKFSLAMFENDPNFQRVRNSYRQLVIDVADAADGVFLWARLAVRSLLKGVGYLTSEKDLKRRLEMMPKGLEDLFDQILSSVDVVDRLRSDQLFLLTTPDCFEKMPAVENAIAYSWLEELDDPGFPYETKSRACTDIEVNERLERVSCMLDRLSRGLLEMSRMDSRGSDGQNYFRYRVRFLHRSAREYIVTTRESQIQSRIPEFDRYSGIFRLLLAELKFSICIPHGWPEPRPGGFWDCPSRRAFDYLGYSVRRAHKTAICNVSSQLLEEMSDILPQHCPKTQKQPPNLSEIDTLKPKCFYGENIQSGSTLATTTNRNNKSHSLDPFCLFTSLGLLPLLSLDLMRRLKQQNLISGPNMLLTAALWDETLFRQLIEEGRTPEEFVPLEPVFSYHYGESIDRHKLEEFPPSRATAPVWIIFYHRFAHFCLKRHMRPTGMVSFKNDFLSHVAENWARCLELFLDNKVDQDIVLFVAVLVVIGDPSAGHGPKSSLADTEDGGSSTQRVVFDLLELLEIMAPPNLETLRTKLSYKKARPRKIIAADESTIVHQKGTLSSIKAQYCQIESVIAPSERLDVPFSFRHI